MATDVSQERKTTFRKLYERLFNGNELSVADEFVTPDFINHTAPPGSPRGPEGIRGTVTMLHTAFPDLHYTIIELIEEGNKLAMWTTVKGTHRGHFMGNPASGKTFAQEQMHFFRLEGDRVAEHWAVRDDLGMMLQLGIMPQRPQP